VKAARAWGFFVLFLGKWSTRKRKINNEKSLLINDLLRVASVLFSHHSREIKVAMMESWCVFFFCFFFFFFFCFLFLVFSFFFFFCVSILSLSLFLSLFFFFSLSPSLFLSLFLSPSLSESVEDKLEKYTSVLLKRSLPLSSLPPSVSLSLSLSLSLSRPLSLFLFFSS